MSHIQKLSGGRWQARYRGPDGREHARNFELRGDADRFLLAVGSSKMRGEWIDPTAGRVTVAVWSGTWMRSVLPTLKPKTVATYESLLRSRILPTLGRYPLASLRPSDVQTWIADMQREGLSPSRIRQAHVVLKSLLDAAVRDDVIGRNVALGARLPRIERTEAAYFEPQVVDAIVADAPEEHAPFLAVQGVLGLRFGEAAALRRRSVTCSGDASAWRNPSRRSEAVFFSAARRRTRHGQCRCPGL